MTAILILADIEGSTGCARHSDAQLLNDGWVRACIELSRDLNSICRRLKKAGASRIRIKDFHRTSYNIFKEMLDPDIELDQGYAIYPATGIGEIAGFDMIMMTGMHAASGTSGFLPHTLSSKFASIEVNGKYLCEAELFSASVAAHSLRPVFFSGCPIACAQAAESIEGITTCKIEKPLQGRIESIREQLANAATQAFTIAQDNRLPRPFQPKGPFNTIIKMSDGIPADTKLRKTWNLAGTDNEIHFTSKDMHSLYWQLIKLAYLTPFIHRFLKPALKISNLAGKIIHLWARRRAEKLLNNQP